MRRCQCTAGQCVCLLGLTKPLVQPHSTLTRLAVLALQIQRQRFFQPLLVLKLLPKLKSQALVAALDPGVLGGKISEHGQHLGHIIPGVQPVAATPQINVIVNVCGAVKTARFGAEGHLFVLLYAQFGQHKLGPVLRQVAKKHQAQTLAQRADSQAIQGVWRNAGPLAPRPCT